MGGASAGAARRVASAKKAAPAAPTRLSDILRSRPDRGELYAVNSWRQPEGGGPVDPLSRRVSSLSGVSGRACVPAVHKGAM